MKAFIPEIYTIKDRKVLTVTTIGDPNDSEDALGALYGTVYGTKFKTFKPKGIKMEVGKLSAFWPDAHLKPKNEWTGIWGVEIPDYVTESDLIQKNPDISVNMEIWKGGTVAGVLYEGKYTEEEQTIKNLHKFIIENGYEISGDHEEVYLTKPDAKIPKTIIQYIVKKKDE